MSPSSHLLGRATFADAPLQVAEDIWWVGAKSPDDEFQCHAYLLQHGKQSVLFDPGSSRSWPEIKRKIESLISFDDIRWFVVNHQGPDTCGAMTAIENQVTRSDAAWVTHWRAKVLLQSQALRLPFRLIDESGSKLDLGGRQLRFIFTPYLHFPGAFNAFDKVSGTLFSSDLFSGFPRDHNVWANGLDDFESIRDFHVHYMPHRDVLLHTLLELEKLPIRTIAPQHGKLITGANVPLFFGRLKGLDCGLFLHTHKEADFQHLKLLNNLLRDTLETLVEETDFRVIAHQITKRISKILPVQRTDFVARMDAQQLLWLSSSDRFRGSILAMPPAFGALKATADNWQSQYQNVLLDKALPALLRSQDALVVPLFANQDHAFVGFAILQMEAGFHPSAEIDEVLHQVTQPIGVAIERELVNRQLELERDAVYERSIRDPLTGLFTRRYLDDSVKRMVELHRRDKNAGFAMLMADIDHFKAVNDTYGHLAGDDMLQAVASILVENSRDSDFPVRFGGEEFAIFLPLTSIADAKVVAERIRLEVEALSVETDSGPVAVTISLGIAEHLPQEDLSDLIKKADVALYEAKETGRNRICIFSQQ